MGLRKALPDLDPKVLLQEMHARAATGTASVLRYACTLVTPVYGGGVNTGDVDMAMPVRATAIRGQLRHWWRLLNRKGVDGRLHSAKELFEAERAIWGGLGDVDTLASSKLKVSVNARAAESFDLRPVATYVQRDGKLRGPDFKELPGYVLFPGQGRVERGQLVDQPKYLLSSGFEFELVIRCMADLGELQREQVLDAVRWWATFGGIGARTRRGCGAVAVVDSNRKLLCVATEEVERQGWRLVLGAKTVDAEAAWNRAVDAFNTFRQGPGFGRNKGAQGNRPGRSRWSEPDAIRRITRQAAPAHKAPVCDVGDAFPRAAFGLPIIFHFKDDRAGDPGDTMLKPCPTGESGTQERMASPLILRPYPIDNGWCPAALCLDLDHVGRMGLSLEGKFRGSPHVIQSGQWQPVGRAGVIAPMAGYKNAIEAFLAYFGDAVAKPAARSGARTLPPAAKRSMHAQGVVGVKLRRMNNGSLVAEHATTRKPWTSVGKRAAELFEALPLDRREELRRGRYIMADIEVAGYDIVAVREPA